MTTAPRKETVGFIGLGMMGRGMAANLLKAGFPLVVYDIDDQRTGALAEAGAQAASGPSDVAARSRIVITMVDTTAQTEDVTVGPGGIVDGVRSGDVVVCMSTVDPLAVQRIHQALSAKGVMMIDSPVTGMIKGANEGTLRAFVGGDAAALSACRDVLAAMTSEVLHIGPLGQGLIMKLINNMLYKVNSIAAIEGMVLGAKAGLDPRRMLEVIGASTGSSPAFHYRADRIIRRDFDGVRLDISCKDLELETALGRSLRVPLFLPNLVMQIYEMGRAAGFGSQDATAIVQIYEQLTGVVVGGDGQLKDAT